MGTVHNRRESRDTLPSAAVTSVPVMTSLAQGTFEIELVQSAPKRDGVAARFELREHFRGDLDASGTAGLRSGRNAPTAAQRATSRSRRDAQPLGRSGGFLFP